MLGGVGNPNSESIGTSTKIFYLDKYKVGSNFMDFYGTLYIYIMKIVYIENLYKDGPVR